MDLQGAAKRSYKVKSLTDGGAADLKFHNAEADREMSVAEYYEHRYNYRRGNPRTKDYRLQAKAHMTYDLTVLLHIFGALQSGSRSVFCMY